jgi:acyl-CoA reductase-like NAD-dependent aldehyde dehydrogenase
MPLMDFGTTFDLRSTALVLPTRRDLYYGGAWHEPLANSFIDVINPATNASLGVIANASAGDVDAAVAAAQAGFAAWRRVPPLERGRILREAAAIVRANAAELALLDATDCGNPVKEITVDVMIGAALLDFFAGIVSEIKGESFDTGPDSLNFSLREPLGVVARIIPFNHPILFAAGKIAAPLAAGNAVILKPPEQAPLSSLRLAELIGHLFPAGAFNVVAGDREAGARLVAHPGVAAVAVTGSVPTGKAIAKSAADRLKPVLLELGGKNALIAFPDADPDEVAEAVVAGMNFTWCGQSCGSTSRAFVHASIHAAVLERVVRRCAAYVPGIPSDPATTMGAIISRAQRDRILNYIAIGREEGANVVYGGGPPDGELLAAGNFVEPTVFAGVTQTMRIANEEIFGPVLSVLSWTDEAAMLADVNRVDYGLTASIWTRDIDAGLRTAQAVEAGYVWINDVAAHYLGAPFGGYKQSGIGREECLEELLAFTQVKNVHVKLRKPVPAATQA